MVCGASFDSAQTCKGEMLRQAWTFSYRKGECEPLSQPACTEQLNVFPNMEQCLEFCVGSCPSGLSVHLNPFTAQPQLCDREKHTGCPLGFECLKT